VGRGGGRGYEVYFNNSITGNVLTVSALSTGVAGGLNNCRAYDGQLFANT
jgi:hypothetical protein